MAQPSVACYFNTRKRNAIEDLKVTRARKVLLVENGDLNNEVCTPKESTKEITTENNNTEEVASSKTDLANPLNAKIVKIKPKDVKTQKKVPKQTRSKKVKEVPKQMDIQELFHNMKKQEDNKEVELLKTPPQSPAKSVNVNEVKLTGKKLSLNEFKEKISRSSKLAELKVSMARFKEASAKLIDPVELLKTPPQSPVKSVNAMDKVKMTGKELSLNEIKQKLSRSSKLAELKASMARMKESSAKLEKIEKKTSRIPDSPSLKAFRSIELEVTLSPQKIQSPEKAYLSPKKTPSTARKNLINVFSPTKNAVAVPSSTTRQLFNQTKPSLTLPYKYRTLAELFRSIDTVCQIMFNRKETITFRKLKPAVEELMKRNLQLKQLAQIKSVFPDSYTFKQEKLRAFGAGHKHEQWELVVEPILKKDTLTADCLLERRRIFFNTLIEKVKLYHNEFLSTLDPPVIILQKISRWHPEFDIERVPDIDASELPQPPTEEKFTTGQDVLAKARSMFNCNTRMEQALERLQKVREENPAVEKPKEVTSVLSGIPKALLEKVRQKQAAKAFESMTRSDEKEKEVQLYMRLPEFARLTRNLYVAEKKSVLPIDTVLEKLSNSLRSFMPKSEIELHLKTLAKEVPTWIVFHTIRNSVFIKISKDADLSIILSKLDKLIKSKSVV